MMCEGNADNDFIVSGGGNDQLIGVAVLMYLLAALVLNTSSADRAVMTLIGVSSQKGDTKSADCDNAVYKSANKQIQLITGKICLIISDIEKALKFHQCSLDY
jgi:Ca2+-binding RTX toxin-like protein